MSTVSALILGALLGYLIPATIERIREEAARLDRDIADALNDPLDEYAETWDQQAADERILRAVRAYDEEREAAVIYDRMVCEQIEREEGWTQ